MKQNPFDNTLAAALRAAAGTEEEPASDEQVWEQVLPTVEKGKWKHQQMGASLKRLEWVHGLVGGMTIDSTFAMSEPDSSAKSIWAEVDAMQVKPQQLRFSLKAKPNTGIRVLQGLAGVVTDVTNRIPEFVVPVKWDGKKPETRERDKDNVDYVFICEDGSFVQVQLCVVSRIGGLWVVAQEIFAGQVIRTTLNNLLKIGLDGEINGSVATTVVPLKPEYAYPGASYLGIMPRMGPKVVEWAVQNGRSQKLSRCVVADWNPTLANVGVENVEDGWFPAVVTWYNQVLGYGFALTPQGEQAMLHFSKLPRRAKRTLPSLDPMQLILVRLPENGNKAEQIDTEVGA